MPGLSDLSELRRLLVAQGVRTAWVKKLSPKQDNEKNQIYLGGGLERVTNFFPATIDLRSASQSVVRHAANPGRPKIEAQRFARRGIALSTPAVSDFMVNGVRPHGANNCNQMLLCLGIPNDPCFQSLMLADLTMYRVRTR